MVTRWMWVVALVGCTSAPPDGSDGKGGTTNVDPDADDDGLTDAREAELGTDPAAFDTDGDTYGDGLEVAEGKDPLDRADRFYEGFWPYNPDKDDMADHGFTGDTVDVGDGFGRLVGVDQFGEEVDLYDFAGHGKYTVIDASATWCESCRKTASWLSGGPDDYQFEFHYSAAREALANGEFHWVTFITDNGGGPGTEADVVRWHEAYPNHKMAVLTDQDERVLNALNLGETYSGDPYSYFPSFAVVDSDMNVVARGLLWDALDFVQVALAEDQSTP